MGRAASTISPVLAHGTTVATNALLQGEIAGSRPIVTDGFRHILEIARQAVPEGYGNSYFWVKPERIVPLRYVREVGGRLNFRGEELRPLDEERACGGSLFPRRRHQCGRHLPLSIRTPTRRIERRAAEIVREEHPGLHAVTVLRRAAGIPRILERAVTTLVDAFIKPQMTAIPTASATSSGRA